MGIESDPANEMRVVERMFDEELKTFRFIAGYKNCTMSELAYVRWSALRVLL